MSGEIPMSELRREVFRVFTGLVKGKLPELAPEGATRAEQIAWRMFEAAAKVLDEEEKRDIPQAPQSGVGE